MESPPYPNRQDRARELASRVLSDAALIQGGADFAHGVLFVTENQINQLSAGNYPALPQFEPLPAIDLSRAVEVVRSTYLGKKLEAIRPKLQTADPDSYLQLIRDYVKATAQDPTKLYDLRHPNILGDHLASDVDQAYQDIHWLRNTYGSPKQSAAWEMDKADRIDNYALIGTEKHVSMLYGTTGRMAAYAESIGLDRSGLSFAELPEDRRQAIASEAYEQWHQLAELASEHDVWMEVYRYGWNRVSALRYRNLDELREGLQSNPDADPKRIITSFLQRNRSFTGFLNGIAARDNSPDEEQSKLTELEIFRRNKAAQSLENPIVPLFSEALEPGEIIHLDSIEEIDEAVLATLAQIDKNAAELYGVATGPAWAQTHLIGKVSERIKPKKFFGKYVNTRVLIMPTDDEFIDTYLAPVTNSEQIDRNSFTRLQAIADLKSTGRGIVGQSLVETIIYTRNIESPAERKHVVSIRGAASGNKVSAYVQLESSAVARTVLAQALRDPLYAGLMSPR